MRTEQLTNKQAEQLESMIDKTSLQVVLFALARICEKKAAHVRAFCADEDVICECDNCGLRVQESQLNYARDLEQRLDAGGTVPNGECPSCGALAYAVAENQP